MAADTLLRAWSHGRVSQVFASLPPRWRRDLQDLLHRAGRSADPEFLRQLRRFFALTAQLWNQRRAEILDAPATRQTALTRWPPQAHQHLGRLLELLAGCDLWDSRRLAELNVPQFLRTQGDALAATLLDFLRSVPAAAAPLQELEDYRITVTPLDESRARVRIEFSRRPPIDTVYVCIDGHWLPEGIVEQWPTWIAAASRWLDEHGRKDDTSSSLPAAVGATATASNRPRSPAETRPPSIAAPPATSPSTRLKALNDELEELLETEPGEAFQQRLAAVIRRHWSLRGGSPPAAFPPETEEILTAPPERPARDTPR